MSDPLDLDAIEHRIRDCSTYNFGLRNADRLAKEDAPALLAALKEAQADNARLTQLAEGRSKLGLLAVYMSDVMDDADMVAARDAYLADVWDAGFTRGFYSGQAMPTDADASESPVENPYRTEAP